MVGLVMVVVVSFAVWVDASLLAAVLSTRLTVKISPTLLAFTSSNKRMTLNQGNEYIRISGIVRSTDILSDNSVLSTQIADATIMYTGEGSIDESNVIGWLARFFVSAIMPF